MLSVFQNYLLVAINSNHGVQLKGIYGKFRISLNNCEFTKFRDFAS